jgi:hypothetical protein
MIKVWHRHARGQADYFMVLVVAKSLNIKYEIDWYGSADTRSYKVLFRKFKDAVDNFKSRYTPQDGALEIYNALKIREIQRIPSDENS